MLDWDGVELEALAEEIRRERPGPDAERTIWAFEQCLRVARLDPELLPYLLSAVACCVARGNGSAPRDVFEEFFRRAPSQGVWERYAPLLA